MKSFPTHRFFFLILLFLFSDSAIAQITVNGYNPRRHYSSGGGSALSISYGNIFWVDGKNVPLPGYSSSLAFFHGADDPFSIEKMNVSTGISVGYERQLTSRFSVRTAFSTAKLITGITSRFDLLVTDKSKITQLGLYSRYTLTKNPARRLAFHWLAGPELIFVKKNAFVEEYITSESADPENYHQNISIVEGAIVTGLGISLKLSNAFSLFSDGMVGISLPGKGFKSSNTGLGVKYSW